MSSPRVGPWMLPVLVVVEVVLVVSGRLAVGPALVVFVAVELALGVATLGRTVHVLRRYRAARVDGVDGWSAAEDALARLVPRGLARVLIIELRLWVCLGRWVGGRHDGRSVDAFGYHRALRTMIGAVGALVVVEGAVTEIVLAVVLPHTAWPWLALAAHLYGLAWLVGLHAADVTRPHLLTDHELLVRDGVFVEIAVPLSDILDVRAVRVAGTGRSGLTVERGVTRLTHGDATVAVDLAAGTLLITLDDRHRGIARIRAATSAARTPGTARPR